MSTSLLNFDDARKVAHGGLELEKLLPHIHAVLGAERARAQGTFEKDPCVVVFVEVRKVLDVFGYIPKTRFMPALRIGIKYMLYAIDPESRDD